MDFHIIIPARLDSTRLPNKVLLPINGKTMLEHVYQRAVDSGASTVSIATDDDQIEKTARDFGAIVYRSSDLHESGTERIAEVVSGLDFEKNEIIVGLQADQPLIPQALIHQVVADLELHDHVNMTTMASKILTPHDLLDPHITKVVLNHRNFAVYFSRAPIPWDQAHFDNCCTDEMVKQAIEMDPPVFYRHIGIYAFRAGFLETYCEWDPSPIEKVEGLEQLRVLWHGQKIHVGITELDVPPGVDTQADLDKVIQLYR